MIARDENYKSKGYGFVCFEEKDMAKRAIATIGSDKAIPWNPQNVKTIEQKIKNNIYVKNIPSNWNEEKLRQEFGKFGNIKSLVLIQHKDGAFSFICYQDKEEKDHEYGFKCAQQAVTELNGKTIEGQENPLYVGFA